MRSFWSLLGEVYLQKISQRRSVVGKWTSSIWIAESCSKTDRGVSPGALRRSLGEQDIELPKLSGIFAAQVGAKQIATFALTSLAQLVLAQTKGKFSVLADLYFDQPPTRWIFTFASPKLEQQGIASRRHPLEFFESSPEFFELTPTHSAFFSHPIVAASQHIKLPFQREEFDIHALLGLLPLQGEQFGFQFS